MKKALATLLGAGLIILSPGLECYRAFADVIVGEAGAGISAGRVVTVVPVAPGTNLPFAAGPAAAGNLKGGLKSTFNHKRPFMPVTSDPILSDPAAVEPEPEPAAVVADPYRIDEGKGVRDVYHNAVELQNDLAQPEQKGPEAGTVSLNRFFEKTRKPEAVTVQVPSVPASYIKEAVRARVSGNGIAQKPSTPASVPSTNKTLEIAKKIGAAAVVVAAVAAAAYGVYTVAHQFGDWLGTVEFNLRHMSSDPNGLMGLGAGIGLSLGMSRETARLQNPKEHYPGAFKAAEKAAAAMGVKSEDLVFQQANGSMEPRAMSWSFEFRAPAGENTQHHISVMYTRNTLGGYDQKVMTYKDAPASALEAGQTARKLQPYYFSRGAEMSPDTALMFSQNKVKGFLAKAFTLALHTDAVTGDQDLHYTFYSDDGSVVRINARTADAVLVRGPPAGAVASLWSRLKAVLSFGGQSGQSELNIPIFIAFSFGVPALGVWALTSAFAMSVPAAFLAVAGLATFAALVFFRGAGGQNSPGSAAIGMAIGGVFACMAVASLIGAGAAWAMAHLSIHWGAASVLGAGAAGLGLEKVGKSGDVVAAFRHTIHGLSSFAQQRLGGEHSGEMAEGIVEDIRYYQKLFDVTPEDPAAQQAVVDVQAFLAALPMVVRKLAVDNPQPGDFRKAAMTFFHDLQLAAENAQDRQGLLVAIYAALAPKGIRGNGSTNGIAAKPESSPAPREKMSSVEVIGKVIAVGIALVPAAVAYYFLAPASLIGYAMMAQSAPIALFALAPKTKSRALLTLPGVLGLGLAAALAVSGSPIAAVAALVNAAGMIHYAVLSTKSDASNYRDEERGLVTYFTALLNSAGFAAFAAFSGWHAGAALAAPALTFLILAANKAFDFKLKFFTSWGQGFARGAAVALAATYGMGDRWFRQATRGDGDEAWTRLLGYVPLALMGAVEFVGLGAVSLVNALLYGTLSGFEKAFEDVANGSYVHRFLAHYRESSAAILSETLRGNGSFSSLSELFFATASRLWAHSNIVTAPLGAMFIALARVSQAAEWVVGGALGIVGGALYSAFEAVSHPAPAFKDYEGGDRPTPPSSKNPPVAVFGKYLAVAISLIPAGLGYFITGAAVPSLGGSLLLSSAALALLAVFAANDSKLLRVLPMIPVGGVAMMLLSPLGAMTMPVLGLGLFAAVNLVGLVHLEVLRKGKSEDRGDRQAVKAAVYLSSLLLAVAPAVLTLSTLGSLAAAALSTGFLVVTGAYRFKGLFWDGLTEGFVEGLGQAVGESLHRTIWWHDLLSFWKGGSWVTLLGAAPVFLFYAVEGVAGFAIGLAASFLWAPLKGLEGGFASAAKDGVMHGFFSRYNAYLSKSVKAFGDLPSEPVFKLVRTLLGSPNLLTVPLGLVTLLVGQALQLAGTAFGAVWGLLAGLIVAANPPKN